MTMKQMYINGVGSGTYKVYISSDSYLDSPSIDYTEYTIPAVNGNVVAYNKRLNNVVRKFDCFIKKDPLVNLNSFKKLIYKNTGYLRIESDYDPNTYQLGYLAQDIKVTPFSTGNNLQVRFTLYFSCKPQKWFKSNEAQEEFEPLDLGVSWSIVDRSDKELKLMLNRLPADQQPQGQYFARITLSDESLNAAQVTDISLQCNGFAFCRLYMWTYSMGDIVVQVNKPVCWGKGSSGITYVSQWYRELTVYAPLEKDLTLNATAQTSAGTKTFSIDFSDIQYTVQNNAAFGVTMKQRIFYNLDKTGTIVNGAAVLQGYVQNKLVSEAMYVMHFELMDSDLREKLVDAYMTADGLRIDIDEENNAFAVKGSDSLDISSYLEVNGNVDRRCDMVTGSYLGGSDPGTVISALLIPEWWQL